MAGHSRALLEAGAGEILALDLDQDALEMASIALADFGKHAHLIRASYVRMEEIAAGLGWDEVDAILLDLGVSSLQLDSGERGFAFMKDGPLDMRFDPEGSNPPASEIVNYWDEAELADIFFRYGEERYSRQIARTIVKARPFETTSELAAVIVNSVPRPKRGEMRGIHPATRVFQALRIAVNDELGTLERTLPAAINLLRPGGRLAVISFHSLEDRLIKQTFKEASEEVISPPGMVLEEKHAAIRLITRKPIEADAAEVALNSRSRSAKLRVAEKL
jgi:16S rRNA (cytosine1402-N4)-methyltransferase